MMITILKGLKCYLIVVLICISLLTSYTNTLGACLPGVGHPGWRDTHVRFKILIPVGEPLQYNYSQLVSLLPGRYGT